MLFPKTIKFIKSILIFLFLIVVLLGLVLYQSHRPQELEVIFFDVGKGDSIFIKTPYHQKILIDGGIDNTVLYKLRKNLPFWDRKIDLIILTHPHADHVTGLVEVLRRYKVKQIFQTEVSYYEPSYFAWQNLIKEKNIPSQVVFTGQVTKLGSDLELITLWPSQNFLKKLPSKPDNSELNNSSIVNKLIYKNTSFLFTGDLEWQGERKLLDNLCIGLHSNPRKSTLMAIEPLINAECNLRADVLKIGHHGSNSSSTQEFLETVSPKQAVISVGKDNKAGHPSPRVLKRLERAGIEIFRTDRDGDVKMRSDGEKIKIY